MSYHEQTKLHENTVEYSFYYSRRGIIRIDFTRNMTTYSKISKRKDISNKGASLLYSNTNNKSSNVSPSFRFRFLQKCKACVPKDAFAV